MNSVTGLLAHRMTPLCQLQDLGRTGYQRYGVSRSGAMDPYSLRLANILAGNPQEEACLEFALAGAVFEITAKRVHIAFVGHFPVLINEERFPSNASYTLTKGEKLEIVASDGRKGTHGYLAIAGGYAAEPQLGSCSTHLRTGLGGFRTDHAAAHTARHPGNSKTIIRDSSPKSGTTLPTRLNESPLAIERSLPSHLVPKPAEQIRAMPGPQTESFSGDATRAFFETPWHIERNSDRMGYRLGGGRIETDNAGSMISEGVCAGCVQVPSGGEPIVLMADCGTIGGYPKIATVISVDRGRLAQMRAGSEFNFEKVSIELAQAALREQMGALGELEQEFA